MRIHPLLRTLSGHIVSIDLCVPAITTSHAQTELCTSPLSPRHHRRRCGMSAYRSESWFARTSSEVSYRSFRLEHIASIHHRTAEDALRSMFGDMAPSVRIQIVDSTSNGTLDRTFIYPLSFDRTTSERLCLDMDLTADLHRRLCTWMTTVGDGSGTMEPTGTCLLNALSIIDVRCDDGPTTLDHRPLDVRYVDGQLTVVNDDARIQPLTVFTIWGEIVIRQNVTPGKNTIDAPCLPSGSYLGNLGDRSGRYVIDR